MQIEILRLFNYDPSWELPAYASFGAAGVDLRACENATLKPLERKTVATGIAVAMPSLVECQIRPRSGLALKEGITVLNSPGTIDSDYRGEIKVILINLSDKSVEIKRGDRIAQAVFAAHLRVEFEEVMVLGETKRGENGFGSTGVS